MKQPQSYCRNCDGVFDGRPWEHREDEHADESRTSVDVKQIERTNSDGERITEGDDGMGHYSPHMFVPVEGVLLCPECGAYNVDGDVNDE